MQGFEGRKIEGTKITNLLLITVSNCLSYKTRSKEGRQMIFYDFLFIELQWFQPASPYPLSALSLSLFVEVILGCLLNSSRNQVNELSGRLTRVCVSEFSLQVGYMNCHSSCCLSSFIHSRDDHHNSRNVNILKGVIKALLEKYEEWKGRKWMEER